MRHRHVLLICRKELLDILRDRRTLFVMMVLPIILYPLLVVGISYVSAFYLRSLRERPLHVIAVGIDHANNLRQRLAEESLHIKLHPPPPELAKSAPPSLSGDDSASQPDSAMEQYGHWEEVISADGINAVILIPEQFQDRLEAGENVSLTLLYNEGIDASVEAWRRIEEALSDYHDDLILSRLSNRDVDPQLLHPITIDKVDLGSGAIVKIGRALAMLLVILSVSGAFYPAVDTGAGEKERGTLETLLVSPAARSEVALAKYLAVCVVAMATIVLNLLSLGLTIAHFASMLPGAGAESLQLGPTIVVSMASALIPLVLLFVALSLALSTQARSVKEANNYLTPLVMAASVPAMAPVIPGLELNDITCLVPVTGTSLLVKDLLAGTAQLSHIILIFVANSLYAAMALRWVARLYEREETLLRLPETGGPESEVKPDAFARKTLSPEKLKRFLAAAQRRSGQAGEPDASQGLLLALVTLVVTFYLAPRLAAWRPESLGPAAWAGLSTLILIGLPLLVALRLCGSRSPFQTLGLRPARWQAWAAALLLAPGAAVAALELTLLVTQHLNMAGSADQQAQEELGRIISQGSLPITLLSLALIPAILEEILYRGFVQQALRRSLGPLTSITVAAVLFGVNHLSPIKLAPTILLGLFLGAMAERSSSTGPSILLHALINGMVLTLTLRPEVATSLGFSEDLAQGVPTAVRIVAAMSLVAGLLLLANSKPRAPASPA